MGRIARRAAPFVVLGIGFLGLGMARQRTFLFIGAAFILIAIVVARRAR